MHDKHPRRGSLTNICKKGIRIYECTSSHGHIESIIRVTSAHVALGISFGYISVQSKAK